MKVTALKLEHLSNPMGMDITKPRLSWKLIAGKKDHNVKQSAYQIQAVLYQNNFRNGTFLWDSGKVESNTSILVPYNGPELESRQRIYWRVKVWDNKGKESDWSEVAWFEMGLLDDDDWKASWIEPEEDFDINEQQSASYTRKNFKLEKPIKKARLYITSLGFYEAWVNGQRVGDFIFNPTRTNFKSLIHYQTYDVKDLLSRGDNAIGVILGDGWYRGKLGLTSSRNVHGERLALLAQLEVEFEDGEKSIICSDGSWTAIQDGPMRENDTKDGEIYDAQKEMPGWNKPAFDDFDWHPVRVTQGNGAKICASNNVPMCEKEQFKPEVLVTPDGSTVLDFGQNIDGYVAFNVQGEAGYIVKMICGESLDENGNFSIEHLQLRIMNLDELRQEIIYTLKGGGVESYKPIFSNQGFRYAKLENWPCEVKSEDFTAIAVYSDMGETGTFECSNPDITQLFKNTVWSEKGNFLDVPTDCPTRERGGWSGDAQIFVRTGTYMMDTAAFFSKWLKEMAIQQFENGMIGNLIPITAAPDHPFESMHLGSAGWGDAAVIIPWTMWKMTGDIRFIEENWDMMQKWVDYEHNHAKKTNPNRPPIDNPYAEYTWDTCFHFGEWFEADADDGRMDMQNAAKMGNPEVATAYFSYSARLLSDCAAALGKEEEAKKYAHISEMAKKAYQFLIAPEGKIDSHHQANFVRPLALELLPEEHQQIVADDLVKLIASRDYHLGTGFLSTVFLCKVLEEHNYLDVAYRLLEQRTMPSWLYSVTKGATTIWEVWHGIDENNVPHNSHNHYSYGAVCSWLMETVAGIKLDEENPGFKQFFIEPKPGGSLTSASATYECPYGEIAASWKIENGIFNMDVTVPVNTSATVILPDGSEPVTVGSGTYQYEVKITD